MSPAHAILALKECGAELNGGSADVVPNETGGEGGSAWLAAQDDWAAAASACSWLSDQRRRVEPNRGAISLRVRVLGKSAPRWFAAPGRECIRNACNASLERLQELKQEVAGETTNLNIGADQARHRSDAGRAKRRRRNFNVDTGGCGSR